MDYFRLARQAVVGEKPRLTLTKARRRRMPDGKFGRAGLAGVRPGIKW